MKKLMLAMLLSLPVSAYASCSTNNNGGTCNDGSGSGSGINGTNGVSGSNGKDGATGVNGKDGSTRVMPVLDTAVRFYDGKYVQLQGFNVVRLADHNKFAGAGSTEFMAGARVVIKLGSSYEEREIARLRKQLGLQ